MVEPLMQTVDLVAGYGVPVVGPFSLCMEEGDVVGLSGPAIMPLTMGRLLSHVPDDQAGTASGIFNTSRQVGGALGVAVFGALLGHGSFHDGMQASLLLAALVATTAAAASRMLEPRAGYTPANALTERT